MNKYFNFTSKLKSTDSSKIWRVRNEKQNQKAWSAQGHPSLEFYTENEYLISSCLSRSDYFNVLFCQFWSTNYYLQMSTGHFTVNNSMYLLLYKVSSKTSLSTSISLFLFAFPSSKGGISFNLWNCIIFHISFTLLQPSRRYNYVLLKKSIA